MRPTTVIGLAGLVIVGIIVADFLIHPQGTATAFNGISGLVVPSEQGLLGQAPSYHYTGG
ncbi:MAG: hypothetical protein M0T72_01910 [Candidatus Dormibacteraeota bacterium]|nr:hypothetical protein [Candidatus Dormibacteraeota bacterium]